MGEHVVVLVDEQRIDGERAGSVSSVGSERMKQREEHGIVEKKVVALKAIAATNCTRGAR